MLAIGSMLNYRGCEIIDLTDVMLLSLEIKLRKLLETMLESEEGRKGLVT